MQKKIFKKLKTFLIWFCVWSLSATALLGVNLSHAKADTLPTVQFNIANSQSQGLESQKIPQIYISIDKIAASDVTIDLAITNGTATSGNDYHLTQNSVTIDEGTLTTSLPLQIIDDNVTEFNETIEVTLTDANPLGDVVLGGDTVFTYTIIDDDQIVTTLSTNPPSPDGANDWFISTPQITLDTATIHTPATLFYQWNGEDPLLWKTYTTAFLAIEGENTLYYYAVDSVNNTETPVKSQIIKVDTLAPLMGQVTAMLTSENQVQLSWDAVIGVDHYEVYRGGTLIGTVITNEYLDKTVTAGQNYVYQVVAVDAAGNESQPETVNIFVPTPTVVTPPIVIETESVSPPVVQPAISSGVSIYKPSVVVPEVKAAETPPVVNNGEETSESSNWNKLLLAISILIIAAGAAVGGYYGYQWWMMNRDDSDKPKEDKPNSKSRW